MVTPGTGEYRAGEKGNEVPPEVRWHGQGFQQVTGMSEGKDWGSIIES